MMILEVTCISGIVLSQCIPFSNAFLESEGISLFQKDDVQYTLGCAVIGYTSKTLPEAQRTQKLTP